MNMLLFLALTLCAAVDAQSANDARSLNGLQCGLEASRVSKRFLSSEPTNNNDWGWHVLLVDDQSRPRSGSLLNSQWVMTNAFLAKFVPTFEILNPGIFLKSVYHFET
jgi:hypothetical protein